MTGLPIKLFRLIKLAGSNTDLSGQALDSLESELVHLSADKPDFPTLFKNAKNTVKLFCNKSFLSYEQEDIVSIGFSAMAYYSRQDGNRSLSLTFIEKARTYSRRDFAKGRAKEELGLIRRLLEPRNLDEAINTLTDSLILYTKCDCKRKIARINGILGNAYAERAGPDDFENAKLHLDNELKYQLTNDDLFAKGNSYHGIGCLEIKLGNYFPAYQHLKQALKFYREIDFARGIVNVTLDMSLALPKPNKQEVIDQLESVYDLRGYIPEGDKAGLKEKVYAIIEKIEDKDLKQKFDAFFNSTV